MSWLPSGRVPSIGRTSVPTKSMPNCRRQLYPYIDDFGKERCRHSSLVERRQDNVLCEVRCRSLQGPSRPRAIKYSELLIEAVPRV